MSSLGTHSHWLVLSGNTDAAFEVITEVPGS